MSTVRAACIAIMLMFCVASTAASQAAAPDCTAHPSPVRLCLTIAIRSAVEMTWSSLVKSSDLTRIADMQAADGRLDLARETLGLAAAAAEQPLSGNYMGRVATRRAALGDEAAAEAEAAAFTEPFERAWYLIAVVKGIPKSEDAMIVERLVKAVRLAVDPAALPGGSGPKARRGPTSRHQVYFLLARALAEAGWIDLALAQNSAEPQNMPPPVMPISELIRARLEYGSAAEAEALVTRLAPSDADLWLMIATALVDKHQYAAALDFIARHPDVADMQRVLARARLGTGDIAGARAIALSASVDRTDDWKEVWREIAISDAAAGRIDQAMAALPRASPQWETSTRAAIAKALARAGRKNQATQFARSAFRAFVAAGEFGDLNLPGVADAFLAAGDVSGAAESSGRGCYLELPLTMAERALQLKHRDQAGAILATIEPLLKTCVEKSPKLVTDNEAGDSIAGRFLCDFAQLHPHQESLAKLAAMDARFRRSKMGDADSWMRWDQEVRPSIHGCLAVALAKSGDLSAARSFAETAPTHDMTFEALLALARFEIENEPATAIPLIKAVATMAGGDLDHRRKDELDFLTATLTCLYGDRRELVPVALGARCRAH
jgi:tetratricopeptide (TPR) repeat protein